MEARPYRAAHEGQALLGAGMAMRAQRAQAAQANNCPFDPGPTTRALSSFLSAKLLFVHKQAGGLAANEDKFK